MGSMLSLGLATNPPGVWCASSASKSAHSMECGLHAVYDHAVHASALSTALPKAGMLVSWLSKHHSDQLLLDCPRLAPSLPVGCC